MPKIVPYNPLAALAALAAQAGAVQGFQQRSQQGFNNAMQIQQFNNSLQQAAENRRLQEQQIGNQVAAQNQEAQLASNRLAAQQQQQQAENEIRQRQLAQQLEIEKMQQEGMTNRQTQQIDAQHETTQNKNTINEQKIQEANTLIDLLQQSGQIDASKAGQMKANLIAGRNIATGGAGGAGDISKQRLDMARQKESYSSIEKSMNLDIRNAEAAEKNATDLLNSMMKSSKYRNARPGTKEKAEIDAALAQKKKAAQDVASKRDELSYWLRFTAQGGSPGQITPAVSGAAPTTMPSAIAQEAPAQSPAPVRPNPNANVQIGASRKLIMSIIQKVGPDKAKVRQTIIEMGLNPDLPVVED
jgi:hypothetical protein